MLRESCDCYGETCRLSLSIPFAGKPTGPPRRKEHQDTEGNAESVRGFRDCSRDRESSHIAY